MDVSSILTGGGTASLIVAVAYVGKQLLDWRRATPRGSRATAAVTDAQTANAILTRTVETQAAELGRQARKIKHLEEEAEAKDRKIDELEARLNDIAAELASLKSSR